MLQTTTRRLRGTITTRTVSVPWLSTSTPSTTRSFTAAMSLASSSSSSEPAAVPTPSRYAFHIAAAYSPKGKPYDPSKDAYTHAPAATWPDLKRLRSDAGQDAFFVAAGPHSGDVAVGVADGVGGAGDDSTLFSQGLCARMARLAAHDLSNTITPKSLLSAAYKRLVVGQRIRGGASTACVGIFRPSGKLDAANLGDSGFVVAREGKIVFASPSQTHYFNCPLQLQMVPRHLLLRTGSSDLPSDAACTAHVLRTGDVVVFATDGVWDNVSSQDILRVVTGEMVSAGAWRVGSGNGIVTDSTGLGKALGEGIQGSVARAVVAKAKAASEDDKLDGPFAKEVKKAFPGEVFRGGKVDDICVVSCVVGDAPPLVVEVPIKAKL